MDNFIFLPARSKKNAGNSATGKLSVALGQHCTASGDYSLADGSGCTASTTCSVALGNAADASGTCGFMYKDICDNTFCFDSGGQNGSGHIKINGNLVAGAGHLPVGYIMPFAGINPPDLQTGWMLCDGSQLAAAEYPKLFTAIGTTYTDAEVTGYFNVPDLRGRTIFGSLGSADATEDQRAGSAVVGFFVGDRKITSAYLPSHTHTITMTGNYTPSSVTPTTLSIPAASAAHTHTITWRAPLMDFTSIMNAEALEQIAAQGLAAPNLRVKTWDNPVTGAFNFYNPIYPIPGGVAPYNYLTCSDTAGHLAQGWCAGANISPVAGYSQGIWPMLDCDGGSPGEDCWRSDWFNGENITATTTLTLVPTSSEPAKSEDYLPPTLVMNFIIRCK